MKRPLWVLIAGVAAAAVLLGPPAIARSAQPTAPTVVLQNNMLRSIAHLKAVGATDPNRVISIGVGLQGNDPAAEAAYVAGEYNPASPLYGQYLSPDDYEARFGVPATRVNTTLQWLRSAGLKTQTVDGSSQYLTASGTVAQVQKLLGVTFSDYRAGDIAFYANTKAPTVPSNLGIIGFVGLNSLEGPRLNTQQKMPAAPAAPKPALPATISPDMNIDLQTPADLWDVYNQPAENKGDGQQIAIFGWGTTKNTESDLRGFEREYGLPAVPLTINYYGPENDVTDSGGEVEWNIDTQASTGMAPNVAGETMYMGKSGTDADLLAAYNAWAGDKHGALQGSSSFGGCEEAPGTDGLAGSPGSPSGVIIAGNPHQDLYEAALRKMVAEGRTMFASTGDTGAGCPTVSLVLNGATLVPTPMLNYPTVGANAVAVGGTVLYSNPATTTTPTSRALEYGWTHGGGGFSLFNAAGDYQKVSPAILTPCLTDPHGTPYTAPTNCRGIPDVAAISGDIVSNGYTITAGGVNDSSGGGTSLSSPLWAGMWTRIQAASTKKGGLGFANPAIYAVANDPAKNAKDFFDIGGVSTDTIPSCNGVTPLNCSHPGWDYLTGWGTPNVTELMKDLDGGRTKPVKKTKLKPLPPLPVDTHGGTTCPGPQVVDPAGDTPNDYPAGDGTNLDNLDITSIVYSSPDANTLRVTTTLKDLEVPLPTSGMLSAVWNVYFTSGDTAYNAQATVNGAGPAAAWAFTDSAGNAVNGVAVTGPNGTITMDIPLADIGNPAAGASITQTFGDVHGSFTVGGTGEYFTAAADRAPDSGNGATWTVGKTC